MDALFCEQGKSTPLFLSTTAAVFKLDRWTGNVPGSSAFEEESDEPGCKYLDELGACAGPAGILAARSESLGVGGFFVRIHVALRWLWRGNAGSRSRFGTGIGRNRPK